MTVSTYQNTAIDSFTRIAGCVGLLFDDTVEGRTIEEHFSPQFRPDPASRCLNRPCELSDLMCQSIT